MARAFALCFTFGVVQGVVLIRPAPMPAPTPSSSSSRIDVRALSLVQLQKLADGGSRRARAELEGRMRAKATPTAPPSRATVTPPPPRMAAPAVAPQGARASAPLRVPPADLPTLTERANLNRVAEVAQASRPVPAARAPAGAEEDPAARPLDEALDVRLALMAQQDGAAARVSGPPRLLGMVLIAWAALLVLGGLVLLARGGGVYYLFCGLGCGAVGWLLMQCNRWALAVHGVLVLVALAWAWRSGPAPSMGLALIQSAPVWLAALWMAVRPVRDGLD